MKLATRDRLLAVDEDLDVVSARLEVDQEPDRVGACPVERGDIRLIEATRSVRAVV